ncbi:PDDEXK-like family protein [Oceanisphaera profunda]|uniref:PDDEXK-like family protein n=1 Tax=Oceanisphaera profunda TaxID=1416627 RepID=UPI0013747BBB|nr:PD-(D/E)XK nuclease family protein [Oceanisphaera profunda]
MSLQSWSSLFKELTDLEVLRTEQKKQGLNDFTLLSSVLSVNDEARLHTRFIYALLDPNGKHYQGSRFLELFLNSIGRQDWLDLSSATVRKEYSPNSQGNQIDLYITDGKRQIVIENKLNAQDQKNQVARYLEAVGATDPALADNTLFIYLTKGRQRPSNYGLGTLSICDLSFRLLNAEMQPIAIYQNLSYLRNTSNKSIHTWLEACAEIVEQNSNLAWAINDYRSVSERATREYVSKVETLKDVLEAGIAEGKQYHQQAIQLAKELPAIHASWLDSVLTEQLDKLFQPAINSGFLTKIDVNNSELLEPYIHSVRKGKAAELLYKSKYNYFRSGKGTRNRGSFYLVTAGVFAHRLVLMMVYGTKMLHVGVLLHESELESERKTEAEVKDLGLSELARSNTGFFPFAMTNTEILGDQGILHLADFASSPQKRILEKMMKTFGCI